MLVCALAVPVVTVRDLRQFVVFVVDFSGSMSARARSSAMRFVASADGAMRRGDTASVVLMGSNPVVALSPSTAPDLTGPLPSVDGTSTDVGAALQAAQSLVPTQGNGRVVVLSDGKDTVGQARSVARSLRATGIKIDCVDPRAFEPAGLPEAAVESVHAPAAVPLGASIPVSAVIATNVAQNIRVAIAIDGKRLIEQSLFLQPGRSSRTYEIKPGAAGSHRITVDIDPDFDTVIANDVGSATVLCQGRPQIAYVSEPNRRMLAVAKVAKAQGIDVTCLAPTQLSTSAASLSGYDGIVLSDVPAPDLSPDTQQAIVAAVRDEGVGLTILGGPNSYGAGMFDEGLIDRAIPLRSNPETVFRSQPTDVVIVLDASGSMSAEEDGMEKVEIAGKAAIVLMRSLRPDDRVAVLAVTETPTTVVPLSHPADAKKLEPAVDALSAGGGGIDCRNGLEAAYSILATSTAPIKHVIICPDTSDSEQQGGCVALATRMRHDYGITTSVVGIGSWSDSDVGFQHELALAGGGTLAVVTMASDLPTAFRRDVRSVQTILFRERPTAAVALQSGLAASRFLPSAPLLGYDLTAIKPDATVDVDDPASKAPLLAHWQFGSGRVLAFTSDDESRWATRWLADPHYSALWGALLRWDVRPPAGHSFDLVTEITGGQGRICAALLGSPNAARPLSGAAVITAPDGSVQHVELVPEPGSILDGSFQAPLPGQYAVSVVSPGYGAATRTIADEAYAPEYSDDPPNIELLNELCNSTGGKMISAPSEVFGERDVAARRENPVWSVFLLLAAFAYVLDILLASLPDLGHALAQGRGSAGQRLVEHAVRRPPMSVAELRHKKARADEPADEVLLATRVSSRLGDSPDDDFPTVAVYNPPERGDPTRHEKP
jgi:Mg-chelatase subunit ChlD/uncharacterized membrane protein